MQLKSELLLTEEQESLKYNSSYKGAYNSMQFVIRLRDDVREYMDEDELSPERFQAFSTYLHETIHWWQHIGSNFGFLLSTSYPSFATTSYKHLQELLKKDLKYKSLIKFENSYFEKNGKSDIPELNILINNFFDLEYAKHFSLDNRNLHEIIKDKRLFISIGHSYMIMWSNSIFVLSETLDKKFKFLPKINEWVPKFQELENDKIEGFYPDSDYHIAPIGIKAIYEGQAVFNQILYLTTVFKNRPVFQDYIDKGMLHGIYLEAFDLFLKILRADRPKYLNDPLIGLFLLVADISINPTNGFPLEIYDYKNFIQINDPGLRFFKFCEVISNKKEYFLNRCEELSKRTYTDLSKYLNRKIGSKCSYKSIEEILNWQENEEIISLLQEEKSHLYDEINLPFRVFFAKYIKFQEDKFENPHYFCWIGHHIPNAKTAEVMKTFEKHSALFIDAADGEIKPIIIDNVNEENLYKTFNKFYQYTILYELMLKWISEDGNFELNYEWLLSRRNEEEAPNIKKQFRTHFGIDLEDIEII